MRTIPRSSKVAISPEGSNTYKVKLTSPAVEGAANKQLLKILSEKLNLPRTNIRIVSGEHARKKVIQIEGMDAQTILQLLS